MRQIARAVRLSWLCVLFSGACLALLASPPAGAQDYPARTTTIVVPYSPGGVVDVIARVVGDQLRVTLGQPVIVENKPGLAATSVRPQSPMPLRMATPCSSEAR